MNNTFAEIKQLGKRLTGLKIEPLKVKPDTWCGNFHCEHNKPPKIQIKKEVKKSLEKLYQKKEFGFNRKYILLQILLHEICHYKQYLKYNWKTNSNSSPYDIFLNYELKKDYYEKVANKFARMYYRKFIK